MFNIGPLEIAVILLIALLVVGPKRLPELGRTIAKSLREFRKAQEDFRRTIEFDLEEPPAGADRYGAKKPQTDRPKPDAHAEEE